VITTGSFCEDKRQWPSSELDCHQKDSKMFDLTQRTASISPLVKIIADAADLLLISFRR
jgi:hypothetical protein